MNKPIILCGLGRVGWRVLEYLQAANLQVVVIDNVCAPDDPRLGNARLVQGDCRRREVLEQAGVRDCGGVIINISNDLTNITTALVVRSLDPEVRIVLRVFNENLIGRLGHAIHNIYPLSTSALVAPLLAVKALTGQALGTFRVERPGNDEGAAAERFQVAELTIPGGSHLRGRSLKEIVERYHAFLVVHTPVNGVERFLTEIDLNARLQTGDQLGVCGDPADVRALLSRGEEEPDANLRWAGWLRRTGRTLWRTLSEIDLSVKVTTLTLLVVILASTLFFVLARRNTVVADALYHTVSVMATAAEMRAADDEDEVKVFVSLLRLLGAALIAAFTAILTNYLVRASLRGALEVRHLPDGGHVIVCGLGGIGYRVVEELTHAKERVVVIEMNRDNRFVATVRRGGSPVILGDASLHEVMRQAHGATARAIVACTNNDMINLEVALLARELNPTQRIVLLQTDHQLAQLLRDAANVRLAVSVPALAAPAFVAGLFGDRVLSVFLIQDRLLAVIDLVIGPQDTHLLGQSGRTVAVDHALLPVAVVPADGSPPPRDPFYACLGAGDRLVAIVELNHLEHLLRRQPPPAEWAVDVTGFELASREWLTLFVQKSRELTEEQVIEALEKVPFCLDSGLTRGQALDLLDLLEREHVEGMMRRSADSEVRDQRAEVRGKTPTDL
ncbi:MAG: NAD-binding protein [Planctomycetes bacterium]|nr:NAD-binding protein [Planctomycetota bacterium]